jgi:hypothetical protein
MTHWALDLDKNSFEGLRSESDKPGSKDKLRSVFVHSTPLAIIMSTNPEFPEDAVALCNELLLLLLDLCYKKNGICLLANMAEFRHNLSNEFLAGLVVFSFLFLAIANSISFSLGQNSDYS